MQKHILIVEDEPAIRDMLAYALRKGDYAPLLAADAREAQERIAERVPDLILLDWMLPGTSGLELARRWRRDALTRDIPIIMLTARGEESDRIRGLDTGADDYLTKPFHTEELLARLRALLRRRSGDADDVDEVLEFEDLRMDLATREVTRGERRIQLTRTEFSLLELLMHHPRRVLTRSHILEEVWGYDFPTSGNALEVYIGYLRRKTEGEGEVRLIHTVRGVGYVLRETP